MKWQNVKLILGRELKDQLRDRRTLFTVLVLPLLLYPLMGMALLQVSQFARQHPTKIWVAGVDNLPSAPKLIDGFEFDSELMIGANSTLFKIEYSQNDQKILSFINDFNNSAKYDQGQHVVNQIIQQELENRKADLAVLIPSKIETDSYFGNSDSNTHTLPKMYVFQNSARDQSNIAAQKFHEILGKWRQKIAYQILAEKQVEAASLDSFQIVKTDVADKEWKQAATWSKILPFIVMIWSLTGAFYPAVDLCAGEKERGTFETLLSSPALRNEIAIGKLLTVIFFSITTSLLNLLSMGFTGLFVVSRLGASFGSEPTSVAALGMPPLSSLFWLLLALIPISALFSAVALAAASFAKSSKEGQYYLVPLMMISMPLMMLPMMPAAKLDLGTSLIPVSGLMLMLRGLIEGQYSEVLPFFGPVVGVTLVCCWLAIRWVVVQFKSESVIFRPSERFSVGTWLKQAVTERHELPLASHALLCGIFILVIKFFMSLGAVAPENWLHFSKQTVIVLVASVAMPAVLMAMFLTRSPAKTLRLRFCNMPTMCAAVLMAICLHPCVMWLTNLVMAIYPPSGDLALLEQVMSAVFSDAPGLWAILLVLALAPALFEELAFRGFILSGLQSLGNNYKAVLLSSLLFGVAHSILQQSIITFFVGCVLGFIAVRTKSIIPCIMYHFVHNGISVAISMVSAHSLNRFPMLQYFLVESDQGGYEYLFWPALLMVLCGVALFVWFWKYQDSNDVQNSEMQKTWDFGLSYLANRSNAK